MSGCSILKRVWSVCAHDQMERKWCGQLDCDEAVLGTDTELVIGWCPACEAHYAPANVRSEVIILNYWQYKTRQGLEKPVHASFVPLKDTPPSLLEEQVRPRVECMALSNAVYSQASQSSLRIASVLRHIEHIRAKTLDWARNDNQQPARSALHLITDLEKEDGNYHSAPTSRRRVHFDGVPRTSRTTTGRKSWRRPASPHPSALEVSVVFGEEVAGGISDDDNDDDDDDDDDAGEVQEEEEVSLLSPLDSGDGQAEEQDLLNLLDDDDSMLLIPFKLNLSAAKETTVRPVDVVVPSALFERSSPVSARRVPLPPSPPFAAILPLQPKIYSPSPSVRSSDTPSTTRSEISSNCNWTYSSSPRGSESPRSASSTGSSSSSSRRSPSAPPRSRKRLAACPIHGKAYDTHDCPTCVGLLLDEKSVAPTGRRREVQRKVGMALAAPLCACGDRGRCFYCLLRDGGREEKAALGVTGWI